MLALPTAILRHQTTTGSHHDWLLADPALAWHSGGAGAYVTQAVGPTGVAGAVVEGEADLWAARCDPPPSAWRAVGSWLLTPLPPHRRRYLWYQGPLTAGRGAVTRVDRGHALPLQWSASRALLRVNLTGFTGTIELTRLSPTRWHAAVRG